MAYLIGAVVQAIEAPKATAPPAEAQTAPAPPVVQPTDEAKFYELLQRVSHRQQLRGLKLSENIFDTLARAQIDNAVAELDRAAASGNHDANVALLRLQHWCSRASAAKTSDPAARISQLRVELTPERRTRAAGVLIAEQRYIQQARERCQQARFDFGGIEQRLRSAADAGEPASATELARFTRDANRREQLLEKAASQGYVSAQYILAVNRLVAVQRGESTKNVSSIRLLLKQAGRELPQAKLDLANCLAIGCDGHPADVATAVAFGLDAARDGEPSSYLSMVTLPWGTRVPREQLLAWQYFGDRLNEAGCIGEGYVAAAESFATTISKFSANLTPAALEQAKKRAEDLWREHGARAQRERGCARAPQ